MEALLTNQIDDPLSLMSFMVPPVRLLSAAMWQVTEHRQVKHYGMLGEFVTMVTETVPELINTHHRAQLILGLRARHLLELLRGKTLVKLKDIQSNLERMHTQHIDKFVDEDMEESETSFVNLVQTLISKPEEKERYFQVNIFPEEYGPKFDKNLQMLMENFLLKLDQMMTVPDLSETVFCLRSSPSLLEKCLNSVSIPKQMKTLLEHRRAKGNLQDSEHKSSTLVPHSLPPLVQVVISRDNAKSSNPLESGGDLDGRDKADGHSITHSETSTTTNRTIKTEPGERLAIDQNWEVFAAQFNGKVESYEDGFPGKELTQTQTKKSSKKTCKRKRDDSADVFREFTFIDHLGAYTEDSPNPSDASKVPWSEEETFGLIEIWGKDSVQRSLKDCARNRHIFHLISKRMMEKGFNRSAEQCHTRIKRLKMSFRQCHESSLRGERPDWKFYNVMEKVICREDALEQEDTINDTSILEEASGQQGERSTDWEATGHAGLKETRNISWTELETQTLIRIWGDDNTQRELKGVLQNGHIFAMISKKMGAHGYIRTAEQCQNRVKRLKLCYKQIIENKQGKDQGEFKFFKQMERIMTNEEPGSSQLKEEELADLENQVLKYQEIASRTETAISCLDDRKKVAWSDTETLILLQLWGDQHVQQNLKRCPHNGHIYTEISEKLNSHGYLRTAEQCHTRIKRLKISYRQYKDSLSSPEAERIEFKFFDFMEDILQRNESSKAPGVNEPNDTLKPVSLCGGLDQITSWCDSETATLIDVWADKEVQKALRACVHNGHVFADIAERISKQGIPRTPEQCRSKIRNLTKNFRQCYERKQYGIEKVDCKFYDKLERVLGDQDFSVDVIDEDEQEADQQLPSLPGGSESGKKTTWSDQETQALLEIWGDDRVQFSLMSCPKNRHIYKYISKRMILQGFNRTGVQCHSRVKRLKSQFYYESRDDFKFYDQMKTIVSKDRVTEEKDISELESITDSDSDSPIISKPVATDGGKQAWGDIETHTLIAIWGSNGFQERLKGCVKRKPVFQQIALVMAEKGYCRTDEQCRSRIKRLKAGYRQCSENHRNEDEQVEWKFFKQLKKIFEKYPLEEA
ncbi:hypothetical protein DNTS_003106 [Danionella cerebrum]|uniref:Myb-like domain-containing protein n=1 Tax=Danionella cerebrum TaxID=2873325 RepID=A0A553N0D1_9TELE|nr:hypothetical protein DNTS_003106 [Danionella translucida]